MTFSTADLVDEYGERALVCDTPLRHYGARTRFHGPVRTVSCLLDNGLLRELLNTPGDGSVLVVDGLGFVHSALVGDRIAAAAADNGWAGLVIHGAVRDSVALAGLDIGITALGTNPRRSTKNGTGTVDVPVGFGGIVFRPGETVYVDEDGVLVLAMA
ncbi:ribonuclease E activity regulator RraA [Sciscionella marina]|uniref:ribonuclease E activity regulator RraA n=1 Tax=Sciscionella marina TaxID=508770 RepID=UPI00036AA774|nr:ribonuclease E activity regulator RraA [Sciscionella marina]